MVKLDIPAFRTFRLGKLYYDYIKGTQLEHLPECNTAEKLGRILEDNGIITIKEEMLRNKKTNDYERTKTYIHGTLYNTKVLLRF